MQCQRHFVFAIAVYGLLSGPVCGGDGCLSGAARAQGLPGSLLLRLAGFGRGCVGPPSTTCGGCLGGAARAIAFAGLRVELRG